MLVREVKNLTNLRLTESDTDGIWLHFDAGDLKGGVSLSSLFIYGDVVNRAIEAWAREQLDRQDVAHRRFQALTVDVMAQRTGSVVYKNSTRPIYSRPSPPVEGGY